MKRSELKSRGRRRVGADERALKRAHWEAAMGQGGCAMCPPHPVGGAEFMRLEAHHVLSKSGLRTLGFPPEVVHAPENALCVCRSHHAAHESYRGRIPRSRLPAGTVAWAEGLGLGWLLDRCYPKEDG